MTNYTGETFILLQFVDSNGSKYTVGGFNPLKWGQLGNESVESYIFSLTPKYRHYHPIVENQSYSQYSSSYSKPVYSSYCYLTTQETYGKDIGLVFGLNREECRIWIDSKSLKSSFV